MEELEKLKDEVQECCKNKFIIFHAERSFIKRGNCIKWDGKNFSDFLSLAKRIGVQLVYLYERIVDEENMKHKGKIGRIEISFLHNGVFHVFSKYADWFLEKNSEEPEEIEEEEKIPVEIVEKSVNELSHEMIESINKEHKELSEIRTYLNEAQRQFWLEKGVGDLWNLKPGIRSKIEKVESKVKRHFSELVRKKEKELLPKLVDECITWCKKQRLRQLTRLNIRFFLHKKSMSLTTAGMEILYLEVNHELKK